MPDTANLFETTRQQLSELRADSADYAAVFLDILLSAAPAIGASDVHLQPTGHGLEICWRLDGVLQPVGLFPQGTKTDILTRLKVLAELLTYRNELPQEGRIRRQGDEVEMRVSTFPTLHGERAVVRLFAGQDRHQRLDDLGIGEDDLARLRRLLGETSGAVLIAGPAGSGKTTTAYACLRELAQGAAGRRSIVSLEDPIESAVPGVVQSQVNEAAGFTFGVGVRSVMRQDPEVILVGEVRDPTTAQAAFQAALTGHLVITTFHAGASAEAIGRLADMGVEPYVLRSGLLAILSQRLLRRLCDCSTLCRGEAMLGLPLPEARQPGGCQQCHQTGYAGRMLIAEMLSPRQPAIGQAIMERRDAFTIGRLAIDDGMQSLWRRAVAAVEQGAVSPAEVRRVLGFEMQRREETD